MCCSANDSWARPVLYHGTFNQVVMIEAGAQDFESADAVVSMPIDNLPVEIILNIMVGGAALCQAAGIPIADVH